MKKCNRCGFTKCLLEFNKQKGAKDGYYNQCTKCRSENNKKYAQKAKDNFKKNNPKYHIKTYSIKKQHAERYGLGTETIRRLGLKLALFVYDRASRKCEDCYSVNDLTVHHIDRKGRNYEDAGLPVNNAVDNLKVLCRRCHGKIHGGQHGKNIEKDRR